MMTKITIPNDIPSSPLCFFLKEFNIAFAKGDAKFITDHVEKDIVWWIYGDKKLEGRDAFAKEIDSMKVYVAVELIMHSCIVQGQMAVVNGEIRMGGKTHAFCDMYNFANTEDFILNEIRSYVIETRTA